MTRPQTASRSPRLRSLKFDKAALLVVPALLLIALAFAYPVGSILVRAFTSHVGSPGGALANFEWYFGNSVQMQILLRTFTTAALVSAICLLICYPFAYLLTNLSGWSRGVLLAIVIISSWQSILVRTFAWKILLRQNGPLSDGLAAIGLGRLDLLGTTTGVTVAMCQVMAPFMILPLYAGMKGIDTRLVDAAKSLGASPARAFASVYVPLSMPGVVAGTLLVFVLSLGFYITPAVVGSPQNSLLSQAIVVEIQKTLDWGHAGAMAVTLLLITVALLGLAAALGSRRLRVASGRGEE